MSLHIFILHKFIKTNAECVLSSNGVIQKTKFWKNFTIIIKSVTPHAPTPPFLTVRVHVALTASAAKHGESSKPHDLRVMVLTYSDRNLRVTKKRPTPCGLSQGRTPSSRAQHLVFHV